MNEDHKTCTKCNVRKPALAFKIVKQRKRGVEYQRRTCRECDRALFRQKHFEWREKNRDHVRKKAKESQARRLQDPAKRIVINDKQRVMAMKRREQMKAAIYLAYGGAICACCGETEPKFLSIDHVNNDGHKHRKLGLHIGGEGFYKAILEAGCPPDFQILCMNCNHGKQRNGGVCPHQDGKVQRLERKLVGSSDPKPPALFCEEVMI